MNHEGGKDHPPAPATIGRFWQVRFEHIVVHGVLDILEHRHDQFCIGLFRIFGISVSVGKCDVISAILDCPVLAASILKKN